MDVVNPEDLYDPNYDQKLYDSSLLTGLEGVALQQLMESLQKEQLERNNDNQG